ncbi:hypothetical protein K457DRAFT_1827745 [Linnemannia elongata AG-77]|uniref:Uncharacterized protein n=1 Tax=Linnemannia elongata AG-77 TaxID=1314771 RepID=A0A197KCS0_9FUNG|nr:hypothetical protein K457DRAFT_1827745 [Linnemannia elongata AG-77]
MSLGYAVLSLSISPDMYWNPLLLYCMFVYLDAFLDTHRAKYPDLVDRWDPYAMYEMLEQVYNGIRLDLLKHGLLTNKAAGEYVMKRSQ